MNNPCLECGESNYSTAADTCKAYHDREQCCNYCRYLGYQEGITKGKKQGALEEYARLANQLKETEVEVTKREREIVE